MPNRGTVTRWANERPDFRRRLSRAKTLGGWDHERCGRASGYCEVTAQEIYGRLCEGEAMKSICADPAMPSASTVARWRKARPAFARQLELGRQVQAERLAEDGWEIAQAVTPADAFATRVKLEQLRWTAGCFDPARFGRFKAVAHESVAAEARVVEHQWSATVSRVEKQPDGTKRVVSYYRNHTTGELRREKLGETDEDASPGPGVWLVQEVKRGLGLTDEDTGGPPELGWCKKLGQTDGDG